MVGNGLVGEPVGDIGGQGGTTASHKQHAIELHAKGRLYNLDRDIGETTNVAAKHPDVVAQLKELLGQARAELGDGNHKGTVCRPVGIAKNPRTLLPRPGVEGEEAYTPTLSLGRRKKKSAR